jgi:hypothetical protein
MKIEKNIKSNWQAIAIISFAVTYLAFWAYKELTHTIKLNHSKALTHGFITSFGYVKGRSRMSASFVFEVDGRKYDGAFSSSDFCHLLSQAEEDSIQKVPIPVVYVPEDPEINEILLKKSQYIDYNVEYPERLASVLYAYFDCPKSF